MNRIRSYWQIFFPFVSFNWMPLSIFFSFFYRSSISKPSVESGVTHNAHTYTKIETEKPIGFQNPITSPTMTIAIKSLAVMSSHLIANNTILWHRHSLAMNLKKNAKRIYERLEQCHSQDTATTLRSIFFLFEFKGSKLQKKRRKRNVKTHVDVVHSVFMEIIFFISNIIKIGFISNGDSKKGKIEIHITTKKTDKNSLCCCRDIITIYLLRKFSRWRRLRHLANVFILLAFIDFLPLFG